MELAVVSNGWGIRDFEVFNSDPFRLCVCERERESNLRVSVT